LHCKATNRKIVAAQVLENRIRDERYFQTGLECMSHELHPRFWRRVRLDELRPTQISVGMAEIRAKRKEWAELDKHERRDRLEQHVFPAVVGPKKRCYIVDHHHLSLALMDEGVEEVAVAVLDDLSRLEREIFWRVMEFRAWCHPYDAAGQRRDYTAIPKCLRDLKDDPYRSLAAFVRNAGGFAKVHQPFAEFLWADYFRSRTSLRSLSSFSKKVVRSGVELAQHRDASYLPGWSGEVEYLAGRQG